MLMSLLIFYFKFLPLIILYHFWYTQNYEILIKLFVKFTNPQFIYSILDDFYLKINETISHYDL